MTGRCRKRSGTIRFRDQARRGRETPGRGAPVLLLDRRRLGDPDRLHAVGILRQVETIGVHHLGPGAHEIADELLLMPLLGIDLRDRAQLVVLAYQCGVVIPGRSVD